MDNIRIKDLEMNNLIDQISICVPEKYLSDEAFRRGIEEKRKWLENMLKKYGSCSKIAYLNNKPVGMIQFCPEKAVPYKAGAREQVIEISCIFVGDRSLQGKGIGSKLLNSLIEDLSKPLPYFNNKPCKFIVTHAFETKSGTPQHIFYSRRGFKQIPGLSKIDLYYPITGEYEPPKTKIEKYKPFQEDFGSAIIFYSPNCPFSIKFAEQIKKLIKEVSKEIPAKTINIWEHPEEVTKRNTLKPIVNGKEIKTFFMNEEGFKKEVKNALENNIIFE